jgi:acetoin utilization protein AcuC
MARCVLVYSPALGEFDFGPGHPLRAERVQRTYDLIEAYGVLARPGIETAQPQPASEERLLTIHSWPYVNAVKRASAGEQLYEASSFGLGTADNPIVPGMYEASALAVGGSVLAAELVFEGKASVAFNIGGGLHHAHRARAAGFCVFNDPAIAIARLLELGGDGVKVAYVDLDAHHGDGVQEAFYESNRVLTISLHESGDYLFPGSGRVDEIGQGTGRGYSVNVPLAPYTGDDVYLWAFRQVVPPLVEAFAPDFVVTQLGADTHYLDPLTHLALSTSSYVKAVRSLRALAPRWIALGGGGYEMTVVPRAWTLAFGVMAQTRLADEIPESQAHLYRATDGRLRDDVAPGLDEEHQRDVKAFAQETVEALREAVFPIHGLPV